MQNAEMKVQKKTRISEIFLFIFLTLVLIPGLTVGLVGAYGFAVWVCQAQIGGPPVG